MDVEPDAGTGGYMRRSWIPNRHERQSQDHTHRDLEHHDNLTGGPCGGSHTTENVTDASRTLLMNLKAFNWDPLLCWLFGIPQDYLTQPEKCLETLMINDRSILAQVSTGEEKSLIVVAASTMKALCEENVPRNYCENFEKKMEAYLGKQVVYYYGDLSNFQRYYLLEKIYTKNILGDRILIQTTDWNIAEKEVARRITLKTIEGVGFGLASSGLETLVENYLQALCEGIVSVILSNIEREVEEQINSISLEKVYKELGSEKAEKIINDLTKTVFARQSYVEEFIPIAKKIAISATQGIAEAVKRGGKTSNKLELLIHAISKILVWSQRFVQIVNIRQITSNLLGDLDQEIEVKLNELEKDSERNQKLQVEKDYASFKRGAIHQCKSLLCENARQIMARHIVSPVLKDGAYHLGRYVGKKVQEAYQSYKETGFLERFAELKQLHEAKIQSDQQCEDNTSISEFYITEKYHKQLQKLMIKTRNPDLLAEIIQENIPMDMVCVSACTQVVPNILKEQGFVISALTIIVEGDNGMRQKFSYLSEESDTENYIPLELKDNHFTFCRSITSGNNEMSDLKNNCLYEALSKAIPELKNIISPEGFRIKVADCIKHDKGIRYHIQQGWHRLPISRGVFGGRPYNYATKPNKLRKEAEKQSPFQHSARGGWKFDEFKDIDLREHKKLTSWEAHEQRAEAFMQAIVKINERLTLFDKKCERVNTTHFRPTKYDSILCTKDYGAIGIALYPVEFETTIDVRLPGEQFKYKVRIDVDNPIIEKDLQGPHGPHVGYEVIRPNKRAPEGVTGHILINRKENETLPDRGRGQPVSDKDNLVAVPLNKLFARPNKPKTHIVRVDTRKISQVDKRKIRGRSFPSPWF